MNWKKRLTNYNFWISIVSAVLLILQAFKFEFDIAYINEIVTAVLGLLVVIGIISDPTRGSVKSNATQKEEKNETKLETEAVPCANEDEADSVINKTNYEAIVKQISADINEKIKEMQKLDSEIFHNGNEASVNLPQENKDVEETKLEATEIELNDLDQPAIFDETTKDDELVADENTLTAENVDEIVAEEDLAPINQIVEAVEEIENNKEVETVETVEEIDKVDEVENLGNIDEAEKVQEREAENVVAVEELRDNTAETVELKTELISNAETEVEQANATLLESNSEEVIRNIVN